MSTVVTERPLERIVRFILGTSRKWPVQPGQITFRQTLADWEFAPTGDYFTMTIAATKVPNFVHRFLQRFILGIRYRMKPNAAVEARR